MGHSVAQKDHPSLLFTLHWQELVRMLHLDTGEPTNVQLCPTNAGEHQQCLTRTPPQRSTVITSRSLTTHILVAFQPCEFLNIPLSQGGL